MNKYFALICIICLILCLSACGYTQEDLDTARAEGYAEGYENGYDAGYETKHDLCNEVHEIDSMNINDIIKYAEDYLGEEIFTREEAQSFAIYAFQKGYDNRKRGIWDDMTEELVDGYYFTDFEESLYLHMLY